MSVAYRGQFPALNQRINGQPLVYLDSAATSQKPTAVLAALQNYYRKDNANVHRGAHTLSVRATEQFEAVRGALARYLNWPDPDTLIWTKGATEAINLVAQSWAEAQLQPGDEIVISALEHHANLVPWQRVATRCGAILRVVPANQAGEVTVEAFAETLTEKTALVALCHTSNALGSQLPLAQMIPMAQELGAKVLVDGAQALAHGPIDLQQLNADFFVLSGHKMFGPTGIGALIGKRPLLEQMTPWQLGGEMVAEVSYTDASWAALPYCFEAGTPNIAGVIGLGAAVEWMAQQDWEAIRAHEQQLLLQLRQGLEAIEGVRLIGSATAQAPIQSFVLEGLHPHDLGQWLDSLGIAIRTGHHCAMPLMSQLQLPGTARVSLALYNSEEDIARLLSGVAQCLKPESAAASGPAAAVNELALVDQLRQGCDWQASLRVLMTLGQQLAPQAALRVADNRVSGCESQTWMALSGDDACVLLQLDSDSTLVRGLLRLLQLRLQGLPAAKVYGFDFEAFFEELGLLRYLSPSRTNGIRAVCQRLRELLSGFRSVR